MYDDLIKIQYNIVYSNKIIVKLIYIFINIIFLSV